VSKRDTRPGSTAPVGAELKLSLEDTVSQQLRGVPGKTRSGVAGYNPYNAVPAARPKDDAREHKPTDLRKLSQWIRLKREVEQLNAERPNKKG